MLSRLEAGLSSAEREYVDFTQLVEETAADSNSKHNRQVSR